MRMCRLPGLRMTLTRLPSRLGKETPLTSPFGDWTSCPGTNYSKTKIPVDVAVNYVPKSVVTRDNGSASHTLQLSYIKVWRFEFCTQQVLVQLRVKNEKWKWRRRVPLSAKFRAYVYFKVSHRWLLNYVITNIQQPSMVIFWKNLLIF